MANTEDKGKVDTYDQSDLLGVKPFGNIGPDRTTDETMTGKKVAGKLKKKKADSLRAKGSTVKSGEDANGGGVSRAIGDFVNR
jgi:hypothetical protein